MSHGLARMLGIKTSLKNVQALNTALVLMADHELTTPTFIARISASAGCDLPSCILAALQVHFGSEFGLCCDRLETLLDRDSDATKSGAAVRAATVNANDAGVRQSAVSAWRSARESVAGTRAATCGSARLRHRSVAGDCNPFPNRSNADQFVRGAGRALPRVGASASSCWRIACAIPLRGLRCSCSRAAGAKFDHSAAGKVCPVAEQPV